MTRKKTVTESPHGEIKVYWQGQALVVVPSKIFNISGMQAARHKVMELIESKPTEHWARIYLFEDSDTIGPMSGSEQVMQSLQYSMHKGCQFLVLVGGNVLNKQGVVEACEALDLPYFLKDTLDEACEFVEQSDLL